MAQETLKSLIAVIMTLSLQEQRQVISELQDNVRLRKSSYQRSMDDIKHGRIEKFASADEMCNSLGI